MTAPTGPEGLGAALAVTGPGEPPTDTAEQLPLLPLPAVADPARGPLASPDTAGKAGRPPGARNKRTEEWVEFLSANYRSPLIMLAETVNRPVEVLAKHLGCSKAKAFEIQLAAAKELAPYMHQKLPQAVDLNGDGVALVNLIMARGDVPMVLGADGKPLVVTVLENEQNQGSNASAPVPVGQQEVGR